MVGCSPDGQPLAASRTKGGENVEIDGAFICACADAATRTRAATHANSAKARRLGFNANTGDLQLKSLPTPAIPARNPVGLMAKDWSLPTQPLSYVGDRKGRTVRA
jgi:hypothetical protein